MNKTESAREIETIPRMNSTKFTFQSDREPGSK
jgi:hypothetical protein